VTPITRNTTIAGYRSKVHANLGALSEEYVYWNKPLLLIVSVESYTDLSQILEYEMKDRMYKVSFLSLAVRVKPYTTSDRLLQSRSPSYPRL
jgi:hypothetical protein